MEVALATGLSCCISRMGSTVGISSQIKIKAWGSYEWMLYVAHTFLCSVINYIPIESISYCYYAMTQLTIKLDPKSWYPTYELITLQSSKYTLEIWILNANALRSCCVYPDAQSGVIHCFKAKCFGFTNPRWWMYKAFQFDKLTQISLDNSQLLPMHYLG